MINKGENIVVVVGPPAAGKTHLTEELGRKYVDYKIYHADDYMQHGYAESLYKLMADLQADPAPKKIIEGVQAARLLRKGVELGSFHADLVIVVDSTPETKARRYQERHPGKAYPAAMEKSIVTVFTDYLSKVQRKPRFETFNS